MKTESKNVRKLHEQKQFSYEKIKDYHAKFIYISTDKFYEKYTFHRNCPVCECNDYRLF